MTTKIALPTGVLVDYELYDVAVEYFGGLADTEPDVLRAFLKHCRHPDQPMDPRTRDWICQTGLATCPDDEILIFGELREIALAVIREDDGQITVVRPSGRSPQP